MSKTLVQRRKMLKKKDADDEAPRRKKKKTKVAEKEKRHKRKPGEPRRPRKGTITEAVLELLAKDPHASSQDIRAQLVKHFPKTKFGKSHLAWYKYQIRNGNLRLPHGKVLPPAKRGRPKSVESPARKKKKKKKARRKA